ncbi:MAG: LysR family transcriptional regulator [Neisseriales bacterium]|nr:MAG: LysR family transcriptional regulator [Neisseriales bacterium]
MIDDILLFLKVVDAGSILAAEKKLSIPHTTAARKIDALEAKIGKALLIRSPKGVSLTEDGKFFYNCFKSYEQKLNDLFEDNEAKVAGKLNVVLPFTFANDVLIPRLTKLLLKYPELELNIIHNFNKFNMKRELYDLAIIDYAPMQQAQKIKRIGHTQTVLVCTPEYVLNYGLLDNIDECNQHLIVCKPDSKGLPNNKIRFYRSDDDDYLEVKIQSKVVLPSYVESKSFVVNHQGIADLPRYLVASEIKSGKLIQLFPEYHTGFIDYYLMRNINENDARYKLFIDYIYKIFENLSDNDLEKSA